MTVFLKILLSHFTKNQEILFNQDKVYYYNENKVHMKTIFFIIEKIQNGNASFV